MTVLGDSTKTVQVDCGRGIEGSTAINAIPKGFCLELENASLAEKGVIRKRAGFNLWGCPLPIKARKVTQAGLETTVQLDSTPVLTLDCKIYRNANGLINSIVTDYFNRQTDDASNSLICEFTNLPDSITLSPDSLLETADGTFISPLFIASPTVCILPITALYKLFDAPTYATFGDVAPWSTVGQTVVSAYRPLLHSGSGIEYIRESSVEEITVTGASRFILLSFDSDLLSAISIGDTLYFESSCYWNDAGITKGNIGVIDNIQNNQIYITTKQPILGTPSLSYFKARILRTQAVKLVTSATQDYFQAQVFTELSPSNQANPKIDTSVLNFWETLISPIGPNLIHASLSAANYQGPCFIYGTQIDAGYTGTFNKYFKSEVNKEVLVCGANGNLFEEQELSTRIRTLESLAVNPAEVPATGKLLSANVTTRILSVPILNANQVYQAEDTSFLTQLMNTKGIVQTDEYKVLTSSAQFLNVDAGGASQVWLDRNAKWRFKRTSSKVYLKQGEIDSHKLFPGATVQVESSGKTVAHHTIKRVHKGQFSYDSFIEINDTVAWTSDSFIYPVAVWNPVFYGTSTNNEYAPLTSSEYFLHNRDLYSTNFDYALYIATGVDGIWRYDGRNVHNLRLFAPPLAYWRSIPNTVGFLPTQRGESGQVTGKLVSFRLTYIYADNFDRKTESPVSPDSDLVITTEPINDGTDASRKVEIRVPSIPQNIGFPADKVKIRAYREFIVDGENIGWRLDAEVDNDYNSPFTSVVVGASADFNADTYDELYSTSELDGLGAARPAPLAQIVTVLGSKLVALNSYDLPKIEFACRRVFDSDSTIGSLFKAWAKVDYKAIGSSDILRFCHVPLTKTVVTEADATDYPLALYGAGFKTYDLASYSANGKFDINTVTGKGVNYTDSSNKFRLKSTTAGNLTLAATPKRIKLRVIGEKLSAPIDFNGDVFTGTIDAATTPDELLLSANTKWTVENAASIVGTDNKYTAFFEQIYSVDTNIGITGTLGGGLKIVQSSNDKLIQIYIVTASGVTLALNDLITVQMNKQVFDTYVEDTIGNIKLSGSPAYLKFNSEAVWKVDAAGVVEGNFTKYKLIPVTLKMDATSGVIFDSINYDINATIDHTSTATSHGPIEIFRIRNKAEKTVLKTSSFTLASKEATFDVTADPSALPVGSLVTVNYYTGSDVLNPDFDSVGFPILKGSLKIKSRTVNSVTVEFDRSPLKIATNAVQAWGGSLYAPQNYVSVDLVNHELKIKTAANITNTVLAGDWHFLILRDFEYTSLSSQVTGWFRVKSSTIDTVTYEYNALQYDTTLANGFRLGKVIMMDSTVAAGVTTRRIPIPVPLKNSSSYELQDLASPLFENRTDFVYTPLNIAKRFALAFNAILNTVGFSFWGGLTDGFTLYPTNGFTFTAHRYPVNRFRSFKNGAYTRPTIELPEYTEPFDKMEFTAQNQDFYSIYGNVKETGDFEVRTVNTAAGTVYTLTFASILQGSGIWWTSVSTDKDLSNRIVTFRYRHADVINSSDGENIVGAANYQTYLAIFKNNSIYRTSLTKTGDNIETERAQSTVGSLSGKNIIPTESFCYFVHNTGVYYLNGLEVEPETTLNRYFDKRVFKNAALLPFTCGFHDPVSKEISIGTPYSRDDDSTVDEVDGQFVYNYNEGVFGWSVNLNIKATWWVRRGNESYFSTTGGVIYKIRSEKANTKYRDYEDGIAFRMRTAFVNLDDEIQFKFIRNFILQLGLESTTSVNLKYTWDYYKEVQDLTVIPLESLRFGESRFGTGLFGSNKYLKPVRGMVSPNRVAQLGLELSNDEIDANLEIYGIFIEGTTTNNRLNTQRNQQR